MVDRQVCLNLHKQLTDICCLPAPTGALTAADGPQGMAKQSPGGMSGKVMPCSLLLIAILQSHARSPRLL